MADFVVARAHPQADQVAGATAFVASGLHPIDELRASQRAVRGRKVLGRAIEHLTDSYETAGETGAEQRARLQAVQLLMALNRELYAECIPMPTFGERCISWLRARTV